MELNIGTFNILNTCGNHPGRRPYICETIENMSCDIIGIQEVNLQGNTEIQTFPSYNFEFIQMREPLFLPIPDFRIDGNALLIKKDIEILEKHSFFYSVTSRVAQILKLRKSSTDFIVINTHLDYMSEQGRLQQIQELISFASQFNPLPILWTGDLNLIPSSPEYSLISQSFRSANVESNGKEPEKTYPTPLEWTYDTGLTPMCLDYIWMQGPVHSISCEIFQGCGKGSIWASDHYPLRANIMITSY